jgi:hypothetical protein
MVFGRHGYETAVEGKNGFVCMVDRAWNDRFDKPEFWNLRIGARSAITRPPLGRRCRSL